MKSTMDGRNPEIPENFKSFGKLRDSKISDFWPGRDGQRSRIYLVLRSSVRPVLPFHLVLFGYLCGYSVNRDPHFFGVLESPMMNYLGRQSINLFIFRIVVVIIGQIVVSRSVGL